MYSTFSESNIKSKIIEIIRTFRSLAFLTTSEVKINELNELKEINNSYEIHGEYTHRALYNTDTSETGTFVIVLDKNLQPKNVKINPQQERRQ
jgi:hypothetical protein